MKARASVLTSARTLELRKLPVPDKPAPGGLLLKIEGCGLCGSDVEQYDGSLASHGVMRFPCIPGHEIVGRVAAIEPDVARFRGLTVGDRVAVHGQAPCGVCRGCMSGAGCAQAFSYGFRALDEGSGLWGGYSEWLEVAPRTKLYPISGALPVEDALLFNPLAAGFDWVLRLGELKVGQSVLILGAGQRGLACVVAAAEAGAGQIIVTGLARDAFKLDLAQRFGAHVALVADEGGVAEAVGEATHGLGVDLVVDTTPLAFQPVRDAIKAVKRRGTIVLAGLKGYAPMPDFPLDTLTHKQLRVLGALSAADASVERACRTVENGRFPLSLMHTHRFGLDKVGHAIELLAGEIEGESALHISILPELTA